MYGRGGRIGLVVLDSDLTIEGDMRRLLPEEVEVHTSRVIYPHGVTAENLAAAVEGLEPAIRSLLPVRPVAVVWACTSGSFYAGRNGHEALLARMRRAAGGVPVTTASGCVVDALEALGITRPAVGTPYNPEINQRLYDFLREFGLEPHPVVGLFADEVDDYMLQEVEDEDIERFLLGLDRPDCDGIVLSCTGLPTARVTPRVERRLGKPVVTSNLAILWNALRLGGIKGRLLAPCRIFEHTANTARVP